MLIMLLLLLLLLRECDITASAYNAAATPGATTAAYMTMLLMRDLEISMQQCL